MNKILKSIIINKITELAKKNLLILKLQINARKKIRNNCEIVDRKNTHNKSAQKRQNCHNNECKRDRNL